MYRIVTWKVLTIQSEVVNAKFSYCLWARVTSDRNWSSEGTFTQSAGGWGDPAWEHTPMLGGRGMLKHDRLELINWSD